MAASLAEQLKPLSSEAQEERLMSFLTACGETPAYSAMANQLNVTEEGVRVILARLENKGRIHFISRNPPRIMLLKPGETPLEAGVAAPREGAAARFLSAEGERMRLGRFIADCERRLNRGPSLREMQDFVGFGSTGYVSRMAEILAERGLVQYGHGVPTKLTEIGRQFFGLKTEGAKKMEKEKRKIVVVQKDRQPPAARVRALCEALATAIRNDPEGGHYRNYDMLGQDIGYSKTSSGAVSAIVQAAQKAGYIMPKPYKCHGLFFTEKGKAKFMPELLPQDEPAQPEIMETPPIAQVAAVVPPQRADGLDFDLNSKRLRITGATSSRAELAAFIGRLGALMPFLGD